MADGADGGLRRDMHWLSEGVAYLPGGSAGAARLVLSGEPEVVVRLRRGGPARRLSLRISGLDGRVTLSSPAHVPLGELAQFLAARADWVRRHVARTPEPCLVGPGIRIPVEGRDRLVLAEQRRGPQLTEDRLIVAAHRPAGRQVQALLKTLARDRLAAATARHAAAVGRRYSALVLGDPRSRWGSCSGAGRLMFSWRLAMMPPGILDYVAAHEVAHLVEMNHSPAFWRVVDGLCADVPASRAWLRAHGSDMHAFRFDP